MQTPLYAPQPPLQQQVAAQQPSLPPQPNFGGLAGGRADAALYSASLPGSLANDYPLSRELTQRQDGQSRAAAEFSQSQLTPQQQQQPQRGFDSSALGGNGLLDDFFDFALPPYSAPVGGAGLATVGDASSEAISLSPAEVELYGRLWREALTLCGAPPDGPLQGPAAASFLERSGLSQAVLHEVWRRADVLNLGAMDSAAFARACRLVACAQNGKPLDEYCGPASAFRPTSEELDSFVRQFNACAGADGSDRAFPAATSQRQLDGQKLRPLLSASELPDSELAAVWALADAEGSGSLGLWGFVAAMTLAARRKAGFPTPLFLPFELQPAQLQRQYSAAHHQQQPHQPAALQAAKFATAQADDAAWSALDAFSLDAAAAPAGASPVAETSAKEVASDGVRQSKAKSKSASPAPRRKKASSVHCLSPGSGGISAAAGCRQARTSSTACWSRGRLAEDKLGGEAGGESGFADSSDQLGLSSADEQRLPQHQPPRRRRAHSETEACEGVARFPGCGLDDEGEDPPRDSDRAFGRESLDDNDSFRGLFNREPLPPGSYDDFQTDPKFQKGSREAPDSAVAIIESVVEADRRLTRLVGEEVRHQEDELLQLRSVASALKQELRQQQQQLAAALDRRREFHDAIQRERKMLSRLQEQRRKVELEKIGAFRDISHYQAEVSFLRQLVKEAQDDIQTIADSAEGTQQKLSQQMQVLNALDAERRSAQEELENQQQLLAKEARAIEEMKALLLRLKREKVDQSSRHSALEETLKQVEQDILLQRTGLESARNGALSALSHRLEAADTRHRLTDSLNQIAQATWSLQQDKLLTSSAVGAGTGSGCSAASTRLPPRDSKGVPSGGGGGFFVTSAGQSALRNSAVPSTWLTFDGVGSVATHERHDDDVLPDPKTFGLGPSVSLNSPDVSRSTLLPQTRQGLSRQSSPGSTRRGAGASNCGAFGYSVREAMRGLPGFDPLENADAAGLPRQLEGLAVDSVKSENVHGDDVYVSQGIGDCVPNSVASKTSLKGGKGRRSVSAEKRHSRFELSEDNLATSSAKPALAANTAVFKGSGVSVNLTTALEVEEMWAFLAELFFAFLQKLVEKRAQIMVELKNDLQLTGVLHSVDQFLNIKLDQVSVADPDKCPHLLSVRNCFLRGSAVRYVHLQPSDVDLESLHELTRKENAAAAEGNKNKHK